MTAFASNFTLVLSILTVFSFIATIGALYAAFGKGEKALLIKEKIGAYAPLLAFVFALGGTLGSLVYSEVIGFAPCSLCKIQRAFLYPQVLILGSFLVTAKKILLKLAVLLSLIGAVIALYHAYTQIGGASVLPCTAEGGDCSKVFFVAWGFITIPAMSLAAFLATLSFSMLALKKDYKDN